MLASAGERDQVLTEGRYTNMSTRTADTTFRQGDEVVLAYGPHEGTPGVFLGLREDVNWADITERNGEVRSHPVIWLAHSVSLPGSVN